MVRFPLLKTGSALAVAWLAGAVLAATQAATPPNPASEPRDANMRAYQELLRSDIRGQKAALITEVMQFTENDDAKFWPIYRDYEAGLAKINDERIALIKEYALNYAALNEETADRLARGALDLEARRHTLKTTCYDRLKSALSAKTAAKFLQVENQILLLIDLQISASLPIVE